MAGLTRRRQHLPGPRDLAVRHHPPGRGQPGRRPAADPPRPPGDPAHRRGRLAVGGVAADGQHRPGAVPGRQADHHGRAVGRPGQRGGRAALRRHPRPHRPRRRRRLHLPPARGDPPDRRPDHRPQGRADRRHRAPGPGDPDPRGHHADDRADHRVRLPGAARAGRRPTRRRCSRSRGWACAGTFDDVSFTVRPGEIVGLAGLVGSGRSEILETIYGARRATAGTVRLAGKRLRPGDVGAAVAAGVGLAPEERKSQALLLDDSVYRNITVSSLGRFARGGFLSGERREGGGPRADRVAGRPAGRRHPDRAHPLGRQPAEGRAGPLAAPRLPGAAARRAHPRRRRRGPLGDLRPGPRPRRPRRGRRRGLERDPGGARSGRPGAGDRRRRRRPRGRTPRRSTSTACST